MAILSKTPPLLERIKSICAEAEAFLDGEAHEQQRLTPGMPLSVYRRHLENKAPGCVCKQALAILEQR